MKKISIQYYDSIEVLPLYNFHKYMTTSNNNWFIVGFDNRQKQIVNDELQKIEEKIKDEYFIAVDDQNFKTKIKTWAKIDNLSTKYNVLLSLINSFAQGFDSTTEALTLRMQYVKLFEAYGYKINPLNNRYEDTLECEKLLNKISSIKTQIGVLKSGLTQEAKKEERTLHKELLMTEIGLGLNRKIDAKKITVAEWIEYGELMLEKAQLQKN